MQRIVKRKKKTRRAVKESEVPKKANQMKTKQPPGKNTRKKIKCLTTLKNQNN